MPDARLNQNAFESYCMGKVERAVIEALVRAIDGGAPFVEEQVLQAVARAAGDHAKATDFAVERLVRRGLLASQWNGMERIGYRPTIKAYEELRDGAV